MALANSGVGHINASDSILLNPAVLPLLPYKPFVISSYKDHLSVSMADHGREALFPAGIFYQQGQNDVFKTKTYGLSLGHAFTHTIAVGASFKYHDFKERLTGEKYQQTKADIGAMWTVNKQLTLGAVYNGLALSDTDLADTLDKASSVTAGISYSVEEVILVKFDIEKAIQENNLSSKEALAFKSGLELALNEWIMARVGYLNDNINLQNLFTAGIAFEGPQFGLHYAYQKNSKKDIDPLHVIDLSIPF